eukprot:363516-Chlamydomonas_euryale.AAC.13
MATTRLLNVYDEQLVQITGDACVNVESALRTGGTSLVLGWLHARMCDDSARTLDAHRRYFAWAD